MSAVKEGRLSKPMQCALRLMAEGSGYGADDLKVPPATMTALCVRGLVEISGWRGARGGDKPLYRLTRSGAIRRGALVATD